MCGGYPGWVSRVGRQRSSSSPSGINQDTENGNLPPSASSQAVAASPAVALAAPSPLVALDACRLVHADQSLSMATFRPTAASSITQDAKVMIPSKIPIAARSSTRMSAPVEKSMSEGERNAANKTVER